MRVHGATVDSDGIKARPVCVSVQQNRVPAAARACATLRAFTSVMAYSIAAVCALAAGARGAGERPALCDRQSERMRRCQSASRTVARSR